MENIRIEFITKLDEFLEVTNPELLDINPCLAEEIWENLIFPNYFLIKKIKKNTNVIKEKKL